MMKNTAFFLLSIICQKAMTLVYFIIVANVFGPAEQGRYSAALAFTALFGVFVDVGTSAMLTREVAQKRDGIEHLVKNVFFSRIVLGIAMYAVIVFLASAIGYPEELIKLIIIAAIAAIIDTCSVVSWAIVRGFHNLTYEATGGVLAIAVMVAIGGVSMAVHAPLSFLVVAIVTGSVANFLFALWVLSRKLHLSFMPSFHVETMRTVFSLSLPFAGAAIFSRIYTYADMALLARFAGEHATGLYSASMKMILALNLIPSSLSASLYPTLSSHVGQRPERTSVTFAKTFFILGLIAFPIAAGIGIVAPQIIATFYNEQYGAAVPILQILCVSLVFIFLYFPLGALLAATNQQHKNTVIYGVAAAISVGGNLVFIPIYGVAGAALTAVGVSGSILGMSLVTAFPYWKSEWRYLCTSFIKIILSTLFMATIVLFFSAYPLALRIGIGILAYLVCVIACRLISKQDVRRFIGALSRSR